MAGDNGGGAAGDNGGGAAGDNGGAAGDVAAGAAGDNAGGACHEGSCKVCTPHSTFCHDGDIVICSATGESYKPWQWCWDGNQYCEDTPAGAQCIDMVCLPGASVCSGDVLHTCSALGQLGDPAVDCRALGQVCDEDACVAETTDELGSTAWGAIAEPLSRWGNVLGVRLPRTLREIAFNANDLSGVTIVWEVRVSTHWGEPFSLVFQRSTEGQAEGFQTSGELELELEPNLYYFIGAYLEGDDARWVYRNTDSAGYSWLPFAIPVGTVLGVPGFEPGTPWAPVQSDGLFNFRLTTSATPL